MGALLGHAALSLCQPLGTTTTLFLFLFIFVAPVICVTLKENSKLASWPIPVVPELGGLEQEGHKFEDNLN